MALCWLGRCVLRGDGWDGLRAPCHRGDPNPGLVTPGGATDPSASASSGGCRCGRALQVAAGSGLWRSGLGSTLHGTRGSCGCRCHEDRQHFQGSCSGQGDFSEGWE